MFFGEKLPDKFTDFVDDDCQIADMLVVVGSTLKVKPISGLLGRIPMYVPQVFVNKEHLSGLNSQFDLEMLGSADYVFGYIAQ